MSIQIRGTKLDIIKYEYILIKYGKKRMAGSTIIIYTR